MTLHPDFSTFIASLNANNVNYLVVGAHALAKYGHPRFTGDLDVLVVPAKQNVERLLNALEAFGFGSLGLKADDFLSPEAVVQLGVAPVRIDLVTGLTGVDTEAMWSQRVPGDLGGHPVAFISCEHLIANKKALGRPKDLADADALERAT